MSKTATVSNSRRKAKPSPSPVADYGLAALRAWKSIVWACAACGAKPALLDRLVEQLAKAAGTTPHAARVKVLAVVYQLNIGKSPLEVIRMGQLEALSSLADHMRAIRKAEGKTAWLKFSVQPDFKHAFLGTLKRVESVLGIRSRAMTLEFVNSVLLGLSDEQLRALAGEREKK